MPDQDLGFESLLNLPIESLVPVVALPTAVAEPAQPAQPKSNALSLSKYFEPIQMFCARPKIKLHLVPIQKILCWHKPVKGQGINCQTPTSPFHLLFATPCFTIHRHIPYCLSKSCQKIYMYELKLSKIEC